MTTKLTNDQRAEMVTKIVEKFNGDTFSVAKKIDVPHAWIKDLLAYPQLSDKIKASLGEYSFELSCAVACTKAGLSEEKTLEMMQAAKEHYLGPRIVGKMLTYMKDDPELTVEQAFKMYNEELNRARRARREKMK